MTENIPRTVRRTRLFKNWLNELTNEQAKGLILDRIDRVKKGNFGKIDTIKSEPGVSEMIVDDGPGYRIYYGEFDGTVVVLMLGGLKGDQKSDIKIAGKLYRQLKETHDTERAKKAAMKDDGKTKPKRK